MKNLGVVGAGVMGTALLRGIIKAELFNPSQLFLVEIDLAKQEALQQELGIKTKSSLAELAETCSTIILAVKPQILPKVLAGMGSKLKSEHLMISVAAGLTLTTLEKQAPKARFIRVMPNLPAQIGQGVSVYSLGSRATAADAENAATILGCIGTVLQLPESLFDAVTALSGSGPALVYKFMSSLIDTGVMLGLSRVNSQMLVTETVIGSAALLKETQSDPVQLMNAVTSPGGTTAAALFELEKSGFSGSVMKAALAAAQRAKELGRAFE